MDRVWFLTNTCYGNWLPGDPRGFVGRVWDHRPDDPEEPPRVAHARPGTPYDEDLSGLERASQALLKCPPIRLAREQAEVLLAQFLETARFRGWAVLAAAVMANHFHLVVGVPGDPPSAKILGDFKSWGTRALTRRYGEPASKTWWTEGGSRRKLPDEAAVVRVVRYVLYEQFEPLVTWSPETGRIEGTSA